jgi:translation initiation factor IF-3
MILDRLAEELGELAVVEQRPNLDGRNMTMLLGPSKAVLSGTLAQAGEANGAGGSAEASGESEPAATETEPAPSETEPAPSETEPAPSETAATPTDGAEPESPAA